MADFGNVHNVEKFKRDGDALLRQVIGNFFSAEVELFYYPTNELLQRFGVNIQLVPLRNVYTIGNDITLLSKQTITWRNQVFLLSLRQVINDAIWKIYRWS